jgi:hypothetical protein
MYSNYSLALLFFEKKLTSKHYMRPNVSVFHSAIVSSLLLVPYQRERKKVRGSTQPALLIILLYWNI